MADDPVTFGQELAEKAFERICNGMTGEKSAAMFQEEVANARAPHGSSGQEWPRNRRLGRLRCCSVRRADRRADRSVRAARQHTTGRPAALADMPRLKMVVPVGA
jgi:hypothetical protein